MRERDQASGVGGEDGCVMGRRKIGGLRKREGDGRCVISDKDGTVCEAGFRGLKRGRAGR